MGNVKDITGKTFNHWYVIKETGRNKSGGAMFLCRCLLCGREKEVEGRSIRSGASKCCGCYRPTRESHTRHNERLYGVWCGMRRRCLSPSVPEYPLYGGRGIKICDEWNNYEKFKEWAYANGYDDRAQKYKCTLDRLNNDGDYSPSNCTWHNQTEQCNNKGTNHLISYNNETHTITEWSRIIGIRKDTLRRRIVLYGWPIERALTEKTHNNGRKCK